MATRSFGLFMRPQEFSLVVQEVTTRLGLTAILVKRGRNPRLELPQMPGPIVMSDGSAADWLFLTREPPDLATIDPRELRPGKWGWLQCDVPREEGRVLYLAEVAAKSDWYDQQTRQVLENPEALSLFRRVAPYFRRRLRRPVWVHWAPGAGPEAEASPFRNLGYSAGALEWVRGGGQLAQVGVPNVRYALSDPRTR